MNQQPIPSLPINGFILSLGLGMVFVSPNIGAQTPSQNTNAPLSQTELKKPFPIGMNVKMTKSVKSLRSGIHHPQNTQQKRILEDQNLALQLSKSIHSAPKIQLPGIHKVSGKSQRNFEPGGTYLIEGKGFGKDKGSVKLKNPQKTSFATLDILSWNDHYILVKVPENISAIPDYPRIYLSVNPLEQQEMTSNAFGFYAKRETYALKTIPRAALKPLEVYHFVYQNYTLGPPQATFSAMRWSVAKDNWICPRPQADMFYPEKVPLKPGFEITGIEWSHHQPEHTENNESVKSSEGKYSFKWLNRNEAKFELGTQRDYRKKEIVAGPKMVLVKKGDAICYNEYRVNVLATGPKGMPPQ